MTRSHLVWWGETSPSFYADKTKFHPRQFCRNRTNPDPRGWGIIIPLTHRAMLLILSCSGQIFLRWDIDPMLVWCWPTVYDGRPALNQRRVSFSYLLGWSSQPQHPRSVCEWMNVEYTLHFVDCVLVCHISYKMEQTAVTAHLKNDQLFPFIFARHFNTTHYLNQAEDRTRDRLSYGILTLDYPQS